MYQVLETTSPDTKVNNDNFVFENSEVKINYNFWSNGGSISFFIFNKLDEPIYIDWNKSHLVYNGSSYEYWFDSEETKSFYSSATQTNSYTFGQAIVDIITNESTINGTADSYSRTSTSRNKIGVASSTKFKPKQIIHIPPKSGIQVSKFSISKSPYYDCDFNLKLIISRKEINTASYSKDDSPLKFRNYLTYSLKESFETSKVVNNEFYISKIDNMNQYAFQGKSYNEEYCKQNGYRTKKRVFEYPYKKPNAFFIKALTH